MVQMLKGIKVVEFTTSGSAPICGKLLAEYGADVILVEDTKHGTSTRGLPVYDFFNMNKKSISINLKDPDGLALMHRMLAEADVFLSNFRVKALKKFGLDYESMHNKYPRLIHAVLSGYGEKGPAKDDPGFDVTAFWGRAGVEYTMQQEGVVGIVPPSSIGDNCTGTVLCGGIIAALFNRERTGKGMKVSTSLMAVGVWANNNMMIFAQNGVKYPPNRLKPARAMMNSYPCKDGVFNMLLHNFDRDFNKLLKIMGREDLIGDPRWTCLKDTEGPGALPLREIMDEAFSKMTVAEARAAFMENDMAFGYLQPPDELLQDPQALENQFIRKHKCTYVDKEMYFACNPVKFDDDDDIMWGDAPKLGEQTVEIMKQHGYSDEEIQAMLDKNTVVAAEQ